MTEDLQEVDSNEREDARSRPPVVRSGQRNVGGLLAALALVALYLVALEVAEPRFFLRDDNATYYLPAFVHNLRVLTDWGELAEWNPFQHLGRPHLGAGQTAVLYPPSYAAVTAASALGDLRWAIDLLVVSHLLVAAAGMWFLLRRFGLGAGATVGAVYFATAPFVILSSRGWTPIAEAAAWAVWGHVLLMRWVERPSVGRALAMAGLQTVFFLCGYPQLVLYGAIYGAVWLALTWRHRPLGLRHLRTLALAVAMAAAWSAPLLLPMHDVRTESAWRQTSVSPETFVLNAVDPAAFAAAQVFSFRPQQVFMATSSLYLVGIPFLVGLTFALFAAIARSRSGVADRDDARAAPARSDLPMGACVVLAGLAWVASTPAWGVVYGVPLLSSFRWPFKHFLFFLLFATPAAVWAWERLARRRRWIAVALLPPIFAGPVFLLASPGPRASFGPQSVDRPVETYRQMEVWRKVDPSLRVATLRPMRGVVRRDMAPALLAFNFATLLGDHQHLGGYEPLLSAAAWEATGVRWGTLTADPREVDAARIEQLGRWSVGAFVAPPFEEIRATLRATGRVRWLGTSPEGIDVYRNLAVKPLVERLGDGAAVPYELRANGLEADLSALPATAVEGPIRVAVVPAEGLAWRADWVDQGPPIALPEGGVLLPVAEGVRRVELVYRQPGLRQGLAIAASATVCLLLGLTAAAHARRRKSATGALG